MPFRSLVSAPVEKCYEQVSLLNKNVIIVLMLDDSLLTPVLNLKTQHLDSKYDSAVVSGKTFNFLLNLF